MYARPRASADVGSTEFFCDSPWLGTNITLIPGVLAGVWWLWARMKRPHLAMRLLIVQIGSYILNPALKDLYGRPRPDMFDRAAAGTAGPPIPAATRSRASPSSSPFAQSCTASAAGRGRTGS